ncbi:MAG: hypothetical protein RLZZ490_616 [Cyanobacteriota bacterium]|jgi:hypothetical protein
MSVGRKQVEFICDHNLTPLAKMLIVRFQTLGSVTLLVASLVLENPKYRV